MKKRKSAKFPRFKIHPYHYAHGLGRPWVPIKWYQKLCLLFIRPTMVIDRSFDGTDFSVELRIKKLNGKLFVVDEKIYRRSDEQTPKNS